MGKMWSLTLIAGFLVVLIYGLQSYREFIYSREVIIAGERYRPAQPAIYENIVIWTEDGKGILGYDLSKKEIFKITTGKSCYAFPAIYGNIIVWQDCRNGSANRDIYGYNLKTQQEFQITTNAFDQIHPAIFSNIVVWEDYRNGYPDIYGYDMSSGNEFPIVKNAYVQEDPAIYGNIVVWTDRRNEKIKFNNFDIYGYDLLTKKEFQITGDLSCQRNPSIFGTTIVWEDNRNGWRIWDIYGYDLKTGVEFQVTSGENIPRISRIEKNPRISENNIVWEEGMLSIEIYAYNLRNGKTFLVSKEKSPQKFSCRVRDVHKIHPVIYKNTVVWITCERCNLEYMYCDIYSVILPTNPIID
jgi:beta propeller repeat protein